MQPERSNARVLVVDDDRLVVELITTRLGIAGYHTICAHDGVEAMEEIRRSRPHGVLLDINMPRLDGFDVLRLLRGEPALRASPVLVLTARNTSEDVRAAIALGARDYLAKPFDDTVLLTRVARLVRRRRPPAQRAPAVLV